MRKTTILPLFLVSIVATLGGCKSEIVQKFDGLAGEMCACGDADCALEVNKKFSESWDEMGEADIDWNSDAGKRDKKQIEDASKKYMECLGEHITADSATETCQADDKAKSSSDACEACCQDQGRFFKSWADPLVGSIGLDALGAGSMKGCQCK